MINQTSNSVNKKNVYSAFSTNNSKYAIINSVVKNPLGTSALAPSSLPESKSESNKKEEKTHALGISIAATALVVTGVVFFLMKGLPKGAYKKLDNWFKKLDDKISILNKKDKRSAVQKMYLSGLKKMRNVADFSKSSFNFATLKDIFITKQLDRLPFMKKINTSITNWFEKISIKTTREAYSSAAARLDRLDADYLRINKKLLKNESQIVEINGVQKTVKEWLDDVSSRMTSISKKYKSGFSERARDPRLDVVRGDLGSLDKDVWDNTLGNVNQFVRSKKTYTTFIAEELAAPSKIRMNREVLKLRNSITHDIADNFKATSKIISDIDFLVNPSDLQTRKIVSSIKNSLKEYKELNGLQESNQRMNLINKISAELDNLTKSIKNPDFYDSKSIEGVSKSISELNHQLKNDKKGDIQEILTIYRKLLSDKEYGKIKAKSYAAVKSLDNAIDLETDKLFDKIRDLKLGSAPADMLSILSSVGIVGWGLTKSDNNDERISVALKYGIPTVGAIATSLYCTIGLVSGGQSLVFGLLSGFAINKLGEFLDNTLKEYKNKKLTLPQMPQLLDVKSK